VVYDVVQAAERRVPVNTASRYQAGALSKQNYFPFKVNGTGVMPVIFATSLLAVPPAIVKFANMDSGSGLLGSLSPGGALYLPLTVVLIATINHYYTFLQFEPNDIADQLKRGVSYFKVTEGCTDDVHLVTVPAYAPLLDQISGLYHR
jgi:preprotein translocase subunit SecY